MVIREKFEEDMQNLKKRLHGIGKITIEMMEKSFVCIQTHDKVHSQEIIDMDLIINDLQE